MNDTFLERRRIALFENVKFVWAKWVLPGQIMTNIFYFLKKIVIFRSKFFWVLISKNKEKKIFLIFWVKKKIPET